MTGDFTWLIVATAFFVGIHPGISGSPLRGMLVGLISGPSFQAVFTVLSFGGLVWMILAFEAAPYEPLWSIPELAWVPVLVMPFAAIFAVVGMTSSNPTSTGQERAIERDQPALGITRVTRHPFLMGVALWAASHIVANGEVASVIFFGGFLVLAIIGPLNIDAKLRHRRPDAWQKLAQTTSIVPFVAILQGRNTFEWRGLGWWRIALSLALYAVLWAIHASFTGAPIVLGG